MIFSEKNVLLLVPNNEVLESTGRWISKRTNIKYPYMSI